MEPNIFGKLLTCNNALVILEEYPDPQIHYPSRPPYEGPDGMVGDLNEGGDFMSLTPKCVIFLELP